MEISRPNALLYVTMSRLNSNAFRSNAGDVGIRDAIDAQTLDLLVKDKVIKYRFPKNIRQDVRDVLLMANVSHRTLFPDIEGISKSVSF